MKGRAVYALGVRIIVAAVVIFVIVHINAPSDTVSTIEEQPTDSQGSSNNSEVLKISMKNVTAKQDQENGVNIQIQFRVINPNKSTVILEAITYNVYTNNTRVVSGDIGEKLEGFVASQESVFPIIANSNITLKDSHRLQPSEFLPANLKEILNGKAHYTINGTYSYKQSSVIEATGADRDFELTFP
jgi:LEA14-like dessication related protein